MKTRDLLTAAIILAGSEEKLGKAIGYSQHAIWKAKKVGRVTAEMAAKLHSWSDGKVSKHDLRPDVFGKQSQPQNASAA